MSGSEPQRRSSRLVRNPPPAEVRNVRFVAPCTLHHKVGGEVGVTLKAALIAALAGRRRCAASSRRCHRAGILTFAADPPRGRVEAVTRHVDVPWWNRAPPIGQSFRNAAPGVAAAQIKRPIEFVARIGPAEDFADL